MSLLKSCVHYHAHNEDSINCLEATTDHPQSGGAYTRAGQSAEPAL